MLHMSMFIQVLFACNMVNKRKRSRTLTQSIGEVLIPFIGPSPHGMMNASALETGPGFHSA